MNGLIILLVFLLSAGLTWYLCHPAARLRILDRFAMVMAICSRTCFYCIISYMDD
jgi:hypothetical protein